MTPLETIITIFATALSVIAIGSNYVLFREYIDAFLIGFLVSQIFRDLKKRVRKYTQKFSNNIFKLFAKSRQNHIEFHLDYLNKVSISKYKKFLKYHSKLI